MAGSRMKRNYLVFICAGLLACSGGGESPGSGGPQDQVPGAGSLPVPEPACSADADCGSDSGCALPAGVCVAFAGEGQVFSVLVNPVGNESLLPYQYDGVAVGPGGRLDLTVEEPIEVSGVVVFGPDDPSLAAANPSGRPAAPPNSETIGGFLVATAPGLIPGTQFRSEAVVRVEPKEDSVAIQDPATGIGYKPTFTLPLLRGVAYEIAFIPDFADATLADLPVFYVSAQFSKAGRFDVVLPSKKEYLAARFTGVVVLDEEGNTPVAGARITGNVGDGTAGTSATTDDKGLFTMVLPPGQGLVSLRVAPGEGSPLFPQREFVYQEGVSQLTGAATPRFVVGPVPPVRDIILQVVHVNEGSLEPAAQALVEARGLADGGEASGFGITDESGIVELTLLEGVFSLTVMPPSGSRFAAKQMVLDLEAKKDDAVFVVPLGSRQRITGTVIRMESGEGLHGAVVTLQTDQVEAFAGAQHGLQDFSVDVVTDETGGFVVFLDAGPYALTVTPPKWSGLARFSQPNIDLTGGDAQLNVALPESALVRGSVTSATDGAEIPGAQVQFYFTAPDKMGDAYWALDETSFAAAIQLAGSTSVSDEGIFSLVIPVLDVSEYDTDVPPGTEIGNGGGDSSAKTSYGLPAVEVIPVDEKEAVPAS